jgi:carbon storage regulator
MLVLSRKPGEEIVIGKNIRLTVLGVRGSQVRLGVTAPTDVHIRREELAPTPDDAGPRAGSPAVSGEGAMNDPIPETPASPPGGSEVERLEAHIRSRLNG